MMMMEMFLRRKKFTVSGGRQTDANVDPLNTLRSVFISASTFLTFLRHCTHKWSFTFTPWNDFLLLLSPRMFLSSLVFISTEAISFPVEIDSNVFSFLLMQVFYVYLVGVAVSQGIYSCLHFPNVDLRQTKLSRDCGWNLWWNEIES